MTKKYIPATCAIWLACTAAIARPLADEPDTRDALDDLIRAVF